MPQKYSPEKTSPLTSNYSDQARNEEYSSLQGNKKGQHQQRCCPSTRNHVISQNTF